MGVVFFSSLAMACGGAWAVRAWKRRRLLRRYAERVARIIEDDETIQGHFREHPKAVAVRERRLCGRDVSIELILLAEAGVISVAVSEPSSFLNHYSPVTAWAKLRASALPGGK